MKSEGNTVFALDLRVEAAEDGIIPIEADITSEESLQAALFRIKAHTEHLDAILHFAGIYTLDSLVEMGDEAFRRIVDINLRGRFWSTRAFFRFFRGEAAF